MNQPKDDDYYRHNYLEWRELTAKKVSPQKNAKRAMKKLKRAMRFVYGSQDK